MNQNKGTWAEAVVVRELFIRGWGLAARRKKLLHGEVDLIFRKCNEVLFVEVKFLNNPWSIFDRITKTQKRNLIKNRVYYSLCFPEIEFSAAIAFVSKDSTNKLNLIRLEE